MAQRQVGQLLDAGDRQLGVVELVDDLQDRVALAEHGRQRVELVGSGPAAGYRAVGLVDVDEARAQADRAGVEARPQQVGHRGDLVGGRRPLLGVRAHHEHAQHRVTDEGSDVQRDVLRQRVEPATEAFTPAPVDAGVEGRFGHLLDQAEHAAEGGSRGRPAAGASDSEQLPGTTVVMPCSMAGNAYGSKHSWAS